MKITKKANGVFLHDVNGQITAYSDFNYTMNYTSQAFNVVFKNNSSLSINEIPVLDVKVLIEGGQVETFANIELLHNRLIEIEYPRPESNNSSNDGLKKGDIIEVNKSEIVFFANNGMGFGKRIKFAIADGRNGTTNKSKKVTIGWSKDVDNVGINYNDFNLDIGEEKHLLTRQELPNINIDETIQLGNTDSSPGGLTPYFVKSTRQLGGGLAHNIMQPSRIGLFIEKIID